VGTGFPNKIMLKPIGGMRAADQNLHKASGRPVADGWGSHKPLTARKERDS
jgi:hypothetical protein